jgi:hypothetical protein
LKKSIFSTFLQLFAAAICLGVIGPHRLLAAPLVTVTESAAGQFTLFNNSANWFVYGFEIERPPLASNPTTTQPGWSAYTCTFSCDVSVGSAFGYVLGGLGSPFIQGIAPHTSSSKFFFSSRLPDITDGTSNTLLLTEPLSIVVYAAARAISIQDGTSNTILFGEDNEPTFPVQFGFRGSVLPGITDGTSNTIFIGETQVTPVPAALPLFATGLGALGLLGWRRRKKAAACAA